MFWKNKKAKKRVSPRRRLMLETLGSRQLLVADLAGISGVVYNDLNNNQIDDDSAYVSGVTVNLYKDDGNGTFESGTDSLQGTDTTDAAGVYNFNRLLEGVYHVERILPTGYIAQSGTSVQTITITAADAAGSLDVPIDAFDGQSQSLIANTDNPSVSSVVNDNVLGGERDLTLDRLSGTLSMTLDVIPDFLSVGTIGFSSSTGTSGRFSIVYDGIDNDGATIDYTGLDSVDLTQGGISDRFQLMAGADQAGSVLEIVVYTNAANFSTYTGTLPNNSTGNPDQELLIDFSDFTVGGGQGATFSDVGALEVRVLGVESMDAQISVIGTLSQTTKTANFAILQPLTLGDLVWDDANGNGIYDSATENGIPGVALDLYRDTNNDGTFTPGTDTLVTSTTTNASGLYRFTDLFPGNYIVQLTQANFNTGGVLFGYVSSPGVVAPGNDVNNDDNGAPLAGFGIVSSAISLAGMSEPTNDGDGDDNTNLTLDFGVYSAADLSIVKTDTPDPVAAGGRLTYTLTVQNNGPVDATGVTVEDSLPAGVTIVSVTPSQGTEGPRNGNIVTVNLGDLADQASATITILVDVSGTQTTQLSNTATVTADQSDTNLDNNSSTVPTNVNPIVDLAVVKTDSIDPAFAGGTLTYSMVVTNNGPSSANNVTLTDVLPAGLTYVTGNSTQGTVSVSGQTITGTIGTLASGASATVTVTTNVSSSASGTITNTATVSADETESNTANNTSTQDTVIDRNVDLQITKTDNVDPVIPGQSMSYTITVTNAGPSDATGVTVTDVLPAGLTLTGNSTSQGTVSASGNSVTVALGNLASGASATITLNVDVASSVTSQLTNTTQVSANENETNTSNNTATETTAVNPTYDLVLVKSDSVDPATPGGTLTYTIDVSNNGPSNATGVTLTDTLPTGTTFVSATGGLTANGQTITGNLGNMAPGASSQFTIVVNIDPAATGTLTNQASVSATGGTESNTANNSDSENTLLAPQIDLAVTKTDNATTVYAGDTLTYTMVVSNSGPSTATGVTLSDVVPSSLTVISASSTVGSASNSGNSVTGSIGTLAPGASATITVMATVNAGASGTLLNTATVSANQTETVTSNNTASDSTIIDPMTGTLSGSVYYDANRNGVRDNGEAGIAGVTIRLTGTDDRGNAVDRTQMTDSNGDYQFTALAAGTYQLTETQPTNYDDGQEQVNPSLPATVGDDKFTSIIFDPNDQGTNFNFGEEIAFSKRRFIASAL